MARRLARLMATGQAHFRCGVARSLTRWPVCVTWWLRVPPAELDDTATELFLDITAVPVAVEAPGTRPAADALHAPTAPHVW